MRDDEHIALNRKVFESMLERLGEDAPFDERLSIARRAALLAVETGTGYYSSDALERFYFGIAREIHAPPAGAPRQDECLVVMTEAYNIGGHTRVAERWMEADRKRRYSLAVTRPPKGELPERLTASVNRSGGNVRVFGGKDLSSTALELRRHSSGFESVLLFTHMYDPVPLVAYGTDEFTRPVGLYNHADHDFWLGAGIADLVADLRRWGARLTNGLRGIPRSYPLTIPVDAHIRRGPGKEEARSRTGLDRGDLVVLAVGSAFKYRPLAGKDFLSAVEPLLESDPAVRFVGIGMTAADLPRWGRLARKHGRRVSLLGNVPHERLGDYLSAADLLLDSYPVSGPTTMADAVCAGLPALTTPGPIGLQDWLDASGACCGSLAEMSGRAMELLHDKEASAALAESLRRRLEETSGADAFKRGVDGFFERLLATRHQVYDFRPGVGGPGDLDAYFLHVNRRSKPRLRLPPVLSYFKESDAAGRWRAIESFGRRFEFGWRGQRGC